MSGSKSLALGLLLLVCFSCTQKGIKVCSGDKLRCGKYDEVLKSIGINSLSIIEDKNPTLWVASSESTKAIKAINIVSSYFVERDLNDQGNLAEKFVPILKTNSSHVHDVVDVLGPIPGIFSVECKDKFTFNRVAQTNCRIVFLSSLLSQGQIENHLRLDTLNSNLIFSYVDLSMALSLLGPISGDQNTISSEMIKLSPFSFHVPYAEKEIAGIQLMLVLGVFIFSGIILGFWLGTKERKYGRKSI